MDRAVIALWLGHESVETTQMYLEATLAMKEQALSPQGTPGRFRPVPTEERHLEDEKLVVDLLLHAFEPRWWRAARLESRVRRQLCQQRHHGAFQGRG